MGKARKQACLTLEPLCSTHPSSKRNQNLAHVSGFLIATSQKEEFYCFERVGQLQIRPTVPTL